RLSQGRVRLWMRSTGRGRIRSRTTRHAVRRLRGVLRGSCWSLVLLRASKRWPWRPPLSESTYSTPHHCVCEYVRQVQKRYLPGQQGLSVRSPSIAESDRTDTGMRQVYSSSSSAEVPEMRSAKALRKISPISVGASVV